MAKNQAVVPGVYSFTELFIESIKPDGSSLYVDLLPLLENASIQSSINSKAITIAIAVADSAGIFETMEINGDEHIIASWKTPEYHGETKARKIAFRITKIGPLTLNNLSDTSIFSLAGISELAYVQSFASIDNYFSDGISQCVRNVFDRAKEKADEINKPLYFKENSEITITKTDGVADFIIPSETPFDTMDYFASWAHLGEDKTNLFFFYQDLEGYNFKALDALMYDVGQVDISSNKDLKYNFSGGDAATATLTNPQIASQRIVSFNQINRSSLYEYAEKGSIHNTVAAVDYFNKSVERKSLKIMDDGFNDGFAPNALSKLQLSDDFLDTFGKDSNSTDWIYLNKGAVNYIDTTDSHLHKKIYGAVYFNNLIQIKIPGNSNLDVGQGIYLNIATIDFTSKEKGPDPYLSGRYLIKDILHSFTNATYYQTVICSRLGGFSA